MPISKRSPQPFWQDRLREKAIASARARRFRLTIELDVGGASSLLSALNCSIDEINRAVQTGRSLDDVEDLCRGLRFFETLVEEINAIVNLTSFDEDDVDSLE